MLDGKPDQVCKVSSMSGQSRWYQDGLIFTQMVDSE